MRVSQAEWFRCLETEIENSTGEDAKIVSTQSVGGGCINVAEIVELESGDKYFVKSNSDFDLFSEESVGLKTIQSTNTIKTPRVIAEGKTNSGNRFLILEAIESGNPKKSFMEDFGRSLALMHHPESTCRVHEHFDFPKCGFGFWSDNHIGSTNQCNDWSENWTDFFGEQRIGFQVRLATENGLATKQLSQGCDKLIGRLGELIGTVDESPALIHGDLWSGNFMVSDAGEPVLVDPAVYFGSRESEFGMIKLFGGFNQRFYDAYNEACPLKSGWDERAEIYQLYHLLNHLNLFGVSYLPGCLEIIRKFT